MSRVISRRRLTDRTIEVLKSTGFPIGDAAPPEPPADPKERHAGWNGQPNVQGSFYVPYAIWTPGTITATSGPLSQPQADVQVPYQLQCFGISRAQVEELADRCRQALLVLRNERLDLSGVEHKVQQVHFSAVGGIGRVDAADPPTFGEVDSITIWLTR